MRLIMMFFLGCIIIHNAVIAKDVDNDIEGLKAEINNSDSDAEKIRFILKLNGEYMKSGQTPQALEYYEFLAQAYTGKEAAAAVLYLSVPILIKNKRLIEAEEICLGVLNDYTGSHWAAECIYALGELYLNVYEDEKTAQRYFEKLVKEYPGSGLAEEGRIYLQ